MRLKCREKLEVEVHVPLAPVAIGRTVLAMVSADGSPSDPNVLIEGVDVTSGRGQIGRGGDADRY